MMIGKPAEAGHVGADFVQGVSEFRRPANPREGEHPRARDARRDGGVGREPRA